MFTINKKYWQFNNNGQAIYLRKIPSVRELAMQLEVNPITVARAYELLRLQQLIFDKRGIGYLFLMKPKPLHSLYRKQEFAEKELPALFRIMYMLGMEPKDLSIPW